jgi:hypothetical protein
MLTGEIPEIAPDISGKHIGRLVGLIKGEHGKGKGEGWEGWRQ